MRVIKPLLTSALVSAAIAATSVLAAAQTGTKPMPQLPKTTDITLTGCLIQGSEPEVFLLDNARVNPKDSKEAAQKYLLVSDVEDTPLKDLVNHEVTATGAVQARTDVRATPNTPAEKELPVFTAKALSSISDRCVNAGR